MADETDKKVAGLSQDEWSRLAQWVRDEYSRRKTARFDREQLWSEIDRSIAMKARPWKPDENMPKWYPAVEPPLQFNALEVNAADVKRMTFPRAGSWFNVSAAITDEYRLRWDKRRLRQAIIGDVPLEMNLDQETADILVKQTMEHFHRIYDFKGAICLINCEKLKYGTGIGRIRKVKAARSAHEYRGQWSDKTMGPKVIPCPLKHTYLDDSWSALLHEGDVIGPTVIRWIGSQPLDDLKAAMEIGGSDNGYRKVNVDRLAGKAGPDGKLGRVEKLECEGDVLVPQVTGPGIYLPNCILEVACGEGGADIIRFRKNPMPFRSYVAWHYFKHDLKSPYADSPLTKGQPVQEIAAYATNDFLAVSRLRALPPVAHDKNDPNFTAAGGPQIYPQAQWATDSPGSIEVQQIGDPAAALVAAQAMVKWHEDTTGSNDARRGERLKSHTTAQAADIEATQGLSRTDDSVSDDLSGPLQTMLHMEYEIAKDSMKEAQYVRIDAEGIDGWVKIKGSDLADIVEFECVGSEGNVQEAAKARSFIEASTFVVGTLAPAAAQLGVPMAINFEAMAVEAYERYGIHNVGKFVGAPTAITGGAASESQIPGIAAGTAVAGGDQAAAVQPAEGMVNGGMGSEMGLPAGQM